MTKQRGENRKQQSSALGQAPSQGAKEDSKAAAVGTAASPTTAGAAGCGRDKQTKEKDIKGAQTIKKNILEKATALRDFTDTKARPPNTKPLRNDPELLQNNAIKNETTPNTTRLPAMSAGLKPNVGDWP